MNEKKFSRYAALPSHPAWEKLTARKNELYSREDDIRSPFGRDYTRILHSMAYRRLKHKTQVFFNINNDHICTRMEHVSLVESVSSTIAAALGLNAELTKAISIGHDLGHAPFGHQGEAVIAGLSKKHLGRDFWHEKNGLRFVDRLELLEDNYRTRRNLDLTYAVRDGIISHCGEVNENGIRPRDISIGLEAFTSPGMYQAATWEGCVVKIADKIAYVGRDIEDAVSLGFLDRAAQHELMKMARKNDAQVMNTTVIMHDMIIDICKNSSPERGIALGASYSRLLDDIKRFNYKHIYSHPRFKPFINYSRLALTEIFEALAELYDAHHTFEAIKKAKRFAPRLMTSFERWLSRYCETDTVPEGELLERALSCENEKIYGRLETKEIYLQAVIDYISGMTDRFAVETFNELLEF